MAEFDVELFLVNLAATITIYSLPIIIVRYAVLKRPVDKHRATVITITYACVALAVVIAIYLLTSDGNTSFNIFPLVLWSYINYKMLIGGKYRRKTAKNNIVNTSPIPKVDKLPILSFSPPKSMDDTKQVAQKKQKLIKKRFCKNCGGLIDDKLKKCTGCGKQYFKFSKRVFVIIIVAILAVGLVGANVYQYIERSRTVAELNQSLDLVRDTRDNFKGRNIELNDKLSEKESELMFWNTYAVICTAEGYRYHHYGCSHLEGRSFYIYNIDNAIALGYTPCLDCCG